MLDSSSSTGRRIARNTISLFASEASGRLISFFANLILARHFDLDPFGQYALAVNLVGLVASFGDLGLNALVVREVAGDKSQASRYLRASLFWRFASSWLMLGGLALWSYFAGYEPIQRMIVIAMGTRLVFDALSGGYVYLLQAHERMTVQGWVVALGSLARFLGLGLVVLLGGGVVAAASVWSVVSAMTLGFLAALGFRNGWKPRWRDFDFADVRGILWAALPLAVMGSLQMLYYRIDVVMLKSLAGNASVALYHNAYRLLEAFLMLANMAALSALPALAARRGDKDDFGALAEKLFRVLIVGGLMMASVGAASARDLMPFLFGDSYTAAGTVLAILFASAAPFFINALTVDVWTIRNPKRLAIWYSGLLILNITLNIWWIPLNGSSGAAASTLVCEWVGVAFALPWILKEMPMGIGTRLRPLVLGAVLGASVVWGLSCLWGGLQWVLLGPLLFGTVLILSRGMTLEECRAMIRGIR